MKYSKPVFNIEKIELEDIIAASTMSENFFGNIHDWDTDGGEL